MKKIITFLLLFANLCSGSAFAWDKHPELGGEFDHATTMINLAATALHGDTEDHANHYGQLHGHANSPSDSPSNSGGHQDDHCSHGSAHLVGIFYNVPLKKVGITQDFLSVHNLSVPYQFISPLLRPPIA